MKTLEETPIVQLTAEEVRKLVENPGQHIQILKRVGIPEIYFTEEAATHHGMVIRLKWNDEQVGYAGNLQGIVPPGSVRLVDGGSSLSEGYKMEQGEREAAIELLGAMVAQVGGTLVAE